MPGANLDSLPNELIIAILGYIDLDDLQTLQSLNVLNWRLHQLTDELLYAKFRGSNPEKFLRGLTLPPVHGHGYSKHTSRVKEVTWNQTYWSPKSRKQGLAAKEKQRLINRLHSFPHCQPLTNTKDLYRRFLDFENEKEHHWWYLELFLLFTPKVERLEVHDTWYWDDHLYWFKTLSANASIFTNLKTVTIHGPLRLYSITPLLALPSLRRLHVLEAVDMREEPGRRCEWADTATDPALIRSSSLEHLSLQHADTQDACVGYMLMLIKGLKSFAYEFCSNDLRVSHQDWYNQYFSWATSAGPAHHHLSTLESVSIRPQNGITTLWPAQNNSGENLQWLPPFENLRTLDVGYCSLQCRKLPETWDQNCLERYFPNTLGTLETLRIEWDPAFMYDEPNDAWGNDDVKRRLPDLIEFMQKFGRSAAIACPRLRHVVMVDWPVCLRPLPTEFIDLVSEFKELGIHLEAAWGKVLTYTTFDLTIR